MTKDLTKFHPQPCATCGHRDMHGEVAGCIATSHSGAWCDCARYASPRDRARDAQEGWRAAREGMTAADASHAMTVSPEGPQWRAAAQDRMASLIASGREFTAEDVTNFVGVAPSPNAIGSLFQGRKDMNPVGFTNATRKEAHGRALRVWKGKA